MLIDYTDIEVLAAWESSLARKLKRKPLDPRGRKRGRGVRSRFGSDDSEEEVIDEPTIKLVGRRMECSPE